jgi:hypothetical protein
VTMQPEPRDEQRPAFSADQTRRAPEPFEDADPHSLVMREPLRTWRDWCPPRWSYLVPPGLLGLAIVLGAVTARQPVEASQPLRGLTALLVAMAGVLLIGIWFKRAMNAPAADVRRRKP